MVTRYNQSYTTPEAVFRQNEKARAVNNTDAITGANYTDAFNYLVDVIPQIGVMLQSVIGTSFVPYRHEYIMYYRDIVENGAWWGSRGRQTLYLPDYLFVTSSVKFRVSGSDTTAAVTAYRERPGVPYYMIDFDYANTGVSWGSDFNDGILVDGTWCYNNSPSQAYTAVSADNAITVTDSATSITVANASAYETLQYIRIEDELLQITARDTDTETLTVLRGTNGTTAAAHTAQQIEIFNVIPDMKLLATRIAGFMYENRVSYQVVAVGDTSVIFERLPNIIQAHVNQYKSEVVQTLKYGSQ